MYSQLLKDHGLMNLIGGSDYNFRTATAPDTFAYDMNRLLAQAEIEPKMLYTAKQVHGTNVKYCDGENGESFIIGQHIPNADGLLTDKEEIALVIKFADCTPIILFDPVNKVQASVHSGWRGTVEKISHVAIQKMVEDFGSEIKNILAFVGPSIAQMDYEVGPEVYAAFSNQVDRDLYFEPNNEKYLLDMSLANYQLLLEAGLSPHNIEVSLETTYASDKLHSARKEGKEYGLNAVVTMIMPNL